MLTEHSTNRGGSSLVRVRCGDGGAGEEGLSILQKMFKINYFSKRESMKKK